MLTAKKQNLDDVIKELESTPAFITARAEKRAEMLQKRREAAEAIATLEAERARVLGQMDADLEAKGKAFFSAKVAFESALVAMNLARQNRMGENFNFDSRIDKQRDILQTSYDPVLDEAIEFFQGKLAWLREGNKITTMPGGGGMDPINMVKTHVRGTNKRAVHECLQYCQAAIKIIEEMKLEPEVDAAEIEKLKAGIPSIDVFQEYVVERKISEVDPIRIGQVADGASRAVETLLEKASQFLVKPSRRR